MTRTATDTKCKLSTIKAGDKFKLMWGTFTCTSDFYIALNGKIMGHAIDHDHRFDGKTSFMSTDNDLDVIRLGN